MGFRDRDVSTALATEPSSAASPFPKPVERTAGASLAGRGVLGSFIVDGAGYILAFDRNMERLTGRDATDVVGQSHEPGLPGHDAREPRPLYLGEIPPADRSVAMRLALLHADGTQLVADAVVTPLGGRSGRMSVEILRVVERIVPAPAPGAGDDRDAVTGLARAEQFMAALRTAFEKARREGHPLSVMLLDIDHLREVNERCGRSVGDEVLLHVGGIMSAAVRTSDLVARIDDDGFAVLLPGTGRGDARLVGNRMRAAVESFDFPGLGEGAGISVSIGIACFPADAEVPFELLRRATDALEEVRRLGRNRVWCYARRPRVTVGIPVYFDGPSGHQLGTSRDVSNSGIFVDSHDELPIGMRLGLTFRLPGDEEPVRVIGRIVRRIDDGPGPLVGLGIEFERYADVDRWRLESFLYHQS